MIHCELIMICMLLLDSEEYGASWGYRRGGRILYSPLAATTVPTIGGIAATATQSAHYSPERILSFN